MPNRIGGQPQVAQTRAPQNVAAPPRPAAPVATLAVGASGPQVAQLQKDLTALGYDTGKADGKFGPATEKAVKLFQEEHGLAADGKVGALSRTAMQEALSVPPMKLGDEAPEVAGFQVALAAKGFKGATDGKFTAETQTLVKAFQKANGLAETGEINSRTWAKATGFGEDGIAGFGEPLMKGASGAAVAFVQKSLEMYSGISVAVDGKFGPKTEAAVKEFQSMNGLPVTGILDQDTWNQLMDPVGC